MAIYKRKTTIGGEFARKGEDIKDGDIVTIANEGQKVEGKYGEQDIFSIKLEGGGEKNLSFNQTSINNMIDAFGEESKNWIGEKVKVWIIRSNIQGKLVPVAYTSHPDAKLADSGEFYLPGKDKDYDTDTSDIPVIEEDVKKEEKKGNSTSEEVNVEDIPF